MILSELLSKHCSSIAISMPQFEVNEKRYVNFIRVGSDGNGEFFLHRPTQSIVAKYGDAIIFNSSIPKEHIDEIDS